MKKKKKAKKKRRSTAWKDLEKYAAKFLNGTRILRGANFSASLPDVVADGKFLGKNNVTILVECKHSQSQPFVDLLSDLTDNEVAIPSKDTSLGKLYFWKFDSTAKILTDFKNINQKSIVGKDIPQYLIDNYNQAKGYDIVGLVPNGNHIFRMVVIAKKNSSERIAYTTHEELESLFSCPQLP